MKYIDLHCDTITKLFESKDNLKHNNLSVDIEKMQKGECLLQNFAVFTDIAKYNSSFTYDVIDFYYQQLSENSDIIRPVKQYDDIEMNYKNGYINAMLTLEDGSVVDNDLNNLNRFYDLGVRMIALTWNYPNGIGYPNIDLSKQYYDLNPRNLINEDDGLTDFGIDYVKRCNELGIIVDVSHLSDKGFYDVLKYSDKPFVASHSNARFLCKAGRNLDDNMIRLLAEKGGVIGLNYCSAFIEDDNEEYTSIKNIVKHIKHIVDVGGIECMSLGSDFDGINNDVEIADVSYMGLLYKELLRSFSENDVEKIMFKNALRVYRECLK